MRSLVVVAIVAQLAGCSLTLMDRASRSDPMIRPVRCDSARTYPIIDTALSALAIGGLVYLFSRPTPEPGQGTGLVDPTIVVVALAGATLPFATVPSAVVGYFAAARCQRYNSTPPPYRY